MFIVKEGYPFIIASLVVAAIVYFLFGAYWAVIPVVLAVYFAYFFRDFHRSMPYDSILLLMVLSWVWRRYLMMNI